MERDKQFFAAITALREALAGHVKETQKIEHEPAQQEPVGEITCWTVKGNLKNTDFDYYGNLPDGTHLLYTSPPAQRKPLTEQMMTKTALWDLVVSKGLVTIHSEQLAPGTWSAHLSVASWIEGHAKSCDISNEAAHGIKENT